MSVKTVIAHHPYEAQREDEISFEKEEVIKVTDFSDPDWWVGKKKDGSLGFFPSNFVTVQEETLSKEQELDEPKGIENPIPDVSSEQESIDNEVTEENSTEETPVEEKKVDKVIGMARVMEDYASQETGEISLHRGGIINVYEIIDDNWSRGELNGKIGKYPHKYVEDIDMPGRPDLGVQSTDTQKSSNGDEDTPKNGFKLAAFGVKQGGIGSLLAGGFPGLKKTSKAQETPIVPVAAPTAMATAPAIAPVSPAIPVTTPTVTNQESIDEPIVETKKPLGKAIVLHPYDAESEDELSLLRGEYVEILDREVDEGWWKGINERGQTGVFPFNFVRELEPESIVPPTPTRTRRSVQSTETGMVKSTPQVIRPASVQSPVTTRPISVQTPAQRPSSISHTSTLPTPPHIASPSISEESKEEETIEKPAESPTTVQVTQSPPIPECPTIEDSDKPTEETISEEESPSPVSVKEEEIISDQEEKESEVEQIIEAPVASTTEATEDKEVIQEKKDEEIEIVADDEKVEEDAKKENTAEVGEEDTENVMQEPKIEEKSELDIMPTGPKLTTPTRARIGGNRARRSPQSVNQEPSQTEILQKELLQEKEEPKEEQQEKTSPPAKPVKPIFAKFPTPFAVGGDALSKAHLKPTRRLWEEKPVESAPAAEEEPVRPSGVKNLASRFNFNGGNTGGNEVLETKLKNHTKNEVEKVRKEFEQLLNEEKEKRIALEQIVQQLLEKVNSLEQ